MKLENLETYQPKTGDFIININSMGKPYIRQLRWLNGPYKSNGGDIRIEYTTEEFQYKVNNNISEISILSV